MSESLSRPPLAMSAEALRPGGGHEHIGDFVEPAAAVFAPQTTVREATELIREIVKSAFVTYAYVTDKDQRLIGLVTMRDLLLAPSEATLGDIMLRDPFVLLAEARLMDALKLTMSLHYPCYPVCTKGGRLLGLVWGHRLFAAQAVEISMQVGSMVGVDREERAHTPWWTCFKFRHPWLQLNLLTAFVAAAVVGVFETTIEQIVVLAVFLPVLAGQSGNTGCQALAVTLRGMTLGEFKAGQGRGIILKETLLGFANGLLVGITAGAGMFFYALQQDTAQSPLILGLVVASAMTVACVLSGICGVLTPLALRRVGADPATASSIFLTTATDVVSMGVFLSL
ncbi:MAG: magnesium transporter, partial [Verrucomicrobia bacterium]